MNIANKVFARRDSALLLSVVILPLISGLAYAQSTTVFGANSIARNCYLASLNAANTGFTSHNALENCDNAIFQTNLVGSDRVATFVNRGIIKVTLEDYVGGAKDYETAISMDPDSGEAYLNRGNLWFIARNYNKAIDDYTKALELGVRQERIALLNKGMAHEYLNQHSLAKSYYESALEKLPEWPTALEKLERVNKKLYPLSEHE